METGNKINVESALKACNSKYAYPVMDVVYRNPKIRAKDLSSKMQVPASNLQRITGRMMSVHPALLASVIIEGKTKGYVLTEEAQAYMESSQEKGPTEDAKEVFGKWISLEGTVNWKQRLAGALTGGLDMTPEETKVFNELIADFKEFADQNSLKEFVGDQLWERMKEYIADNDNDDIQSCMRLLENLTAQNWENAYRLIDYVFEYSIYEEKKEIYRIYKTFDLEENQYFSIKWALLEIASWVRGEEGEFVKEDVLELLEDRLGMRSQIIFYIAEKICRRR